MRYLLIALLTLVLAACDYSLQPEGSLESAATQSGTFDTSFGTNGKVVLSTPEPDSVDDVTVQSDGKILALGTTKKQTGNVFNVARLNLNGTLDTSFWIGGYTTPHWLSFTKRTQAVAISLHPSGTFCIIGRGLPLEFPTYNDGVQSQYDCFRSNGQNSTSLPLLTQSTQQPYDAFASDLISNLVITEHPSPAGGWLSHEGSVTVGATLRQAGKYDQFWLYRHDYSSNTIRETFVSFPALDAQLSAMAQANNGDIFMVGTARDSVGKTRMAVAKVSKDGVLLAKQIYALTRVPTRAEGRDIVLDSSGRVLVTGLFPGLTHRSFVARLNPTTLALDKSYGADGLIAIEKTATGQNVKVTDIKVDAQDRVVLAGQAFDPGIVVDDPGPGTEATIALPPPVAKSYVWVSRVNATGQLDTTFGTQGHVNFGFGNSSYAATGLAISNNGKIVVSGRSVNGNTSDFMVARLNP